MCIEFPKNEIATVSEPVTTPVAESAKMYDVIVSMEKDGEYDIPVVEQQFLFDDDVAANYEWADEDHTIIKRKDFML